MTALTKHGRQVQGLLYENEVLRGSIEHRPDAPEIVSIRELQEQNVQLRREFMRSEVRKHTITHSHGLTSSLQSRPHCGQMDSTLRAQQQEAEAARAAELDVLKGELQALIADRQRQQTLAEAIVHQVRRD
jgi:type II secretory pathway component PulK